MRTRKTVVVLISGKAGAGKTTLAKKLISLLAEKYDKFNIGGYAFAEPLKQQARAFLLWDGNKDEKGRKLLQELGQLGRWYDEFVWVKHFLRWLDASFTFPANFIFIDDWRFVNERDYLANNPMLEIFTLRVSGRNEELVGSLSSDVSEVELDNYDKFNMKVDNSGSLDELDNIAQSILVELEDKYVVE